LKKRTKKLLSLAVSIDAAMAARRLEATCKSFLVLFFKKELLPWRLPSFARETLSMRTGINRPFEAAAAQPGGQH
jgi:hypothetical protein